MELVILIVALVVAVAVLAWSPLTRSHGDAAEKEAHAIAPGADVDNQFKRPPDQSDLL
jgi:hypothetical protein